MIGPTRARSPAQRPKLLNTLEKQFAMPTQQPAVRPTVDITIEERLRMLPRYRVLLYNDDFNDMDHVVRALLNTIMSLGINEAIAIMLRAHTYGEAHVITCLRETAEFYAEGLKQFGLNSTIEPE